MPMNLTEFQQLVSQAIKEQDESLSVQAIDSEYEPLAALINDLLQENNALRNNHLVAVDYIRDKINQMLKVIGTAPLKPEELDEKHLIGLDPLGIISRSFSQILDHSNLTNKDLRLAKDEIQAIFDSVGGGLLVMDNDRKILTSNSQFREMFSPHEDEIVGRTCYEVVCGNKDHPRETCCFKQMTESGRLATQADWRLGDKHFSVVATPIKDSLGNIVRCVLLYIDITELIKVRIALDDERERLAITMGSIAEGVIATDNEGRIALMNKVATELTGWSEEEAMSQPICSVMNIEDQSEAKSCSDFFSDIMLHKEPRVERIDNTILINRHGTRRDIYLNAAPIHQYDRSIAGTILIFRDITKEKRLDEELTKANRLESLGIFAGGIAHDFNNLLTGVLGNVSLAKIMADPKGKIHHLLDETEKATSRAKGLTQQLLTFAKGGMPVKKLVPTGELIKESVEFSLRGSGFSFGLKMADDLLPVEVDEGQINQVIQNLVLNALQASQKDGGIIELTANNVDIAENQEPLLAPGRYVKITVTDHGKGISPNNLNQIFDPFFTTKENGTGLGLATCYSIVRKHHGNITVESEEGKGTTFIVYLPASGKELVELLNLPEGAVGGSGRVLVMDDEELVRTVTKSMLEHSGYEVELANDGTKAIEKYKKAVQEGRPFDVVLMDLTIPGGMGGKESILELLAFDPKVRAIVASGYSNDPIMADCRSYGFQRVIPKPYKLEELNTVVAEVIKEKDLD
jgi:PAS domain S-box-containing protein